jgi:hypothetical protein
MKPGNRKGTNPGPSDRTGRTRRTTSVLSTPRPVLNSTAANCGPPFGTKRPQVQILSPRPVPQVSDLHKRRASAACVPLQPPSRRPEGTKKEHEGTPGKARAESDRQKKHPASPHGTTDAAAQEGSSGHSDPPSATKRPFGRNARPPGSSAIRSRQARDRQRAPPSAEDPVDPRALNDGIADVRRSRPRSGKLTSHAAIGRDFRRRRPAPSKGTASRHLDQPNQSLRHSPPLEAQRTPANRKYGTC